MGLVGLICCLLSSKQAQRLTDYEPKYYYPVHLYRSRPCKNHQNKIGQRPGKVQSTFQNQIEAQPA